MIEEIKERLAKYRKSPPPNFEYGKQKEQFLLSASADIEYLLSIIEMQDKALNDAKEALDNQYGFNGGIIENNKAYMAIFNALTNLK